MSLKRKWLSSYTGNWFFFLLFLTDFRSEDNRDTEECFLLSKYVQHDFFCCSLCVIMWVTSTFSNNRPQRPPVHIVWEVVSHRLRAYLWIILCAYVLSAERWSLYDRWQQITKSVFFFFFPRLCPGGEPPPIYCHYPACDTSCSEKQKKGGKKCCLAINLLLWSRQVSFR